LQPRTRDPSAIRCLAIALAAVVASALTRSLLGRALGERLPYTVFIVAVALATRWGGLRAGVLATLLSVLAGTYFFAGPQGAFGRLSAPDVVSVVLFLVASMVVVAALEIETRARPELEERDRLLEVEYQERMRLER